MKKQYKEQHQLYQSEGYWDEFMIENNSLNDIVLLHKHNKPIYEKIEKWEKRYDKASSNFGKWYYQLQINKLRKKLKFYYQ